jgi:acetolactate synthase-1/2/3 large subunit
MLKRTGSKVVIDALVDAGVTTVFGYPGGAIMPFYDALLDSALEHVLVRHEQSATHAADGYARAGGRLGVCIATSGPGATNLVTGICTAAMDSTPLLCITGQVPTALIGTDAFQEADIPGVVTAISKHYYQVRDVDELPEVISEAIFVATTGRPGPVVVDIPKDVQVATTTRRCEPIEEIDGYVARPVCDPSKVRLAHELLKSAERPVCIVGGGCKLSDATELFRQWCDLARVPVITTLNGIGSADPDYPGWLGMPGMHGQRRSNQAIVQCDLIVAMGIRFDDRVTGKLARFARRTRGLCTSTSTIAN